MADGHTTPYRRRTENTLTARPRCGLAVRHCPNKRGSARTEHRVFERLCRGETQARASGNLYFSAGSRVAPHARLGPALAENSESREAQRALFFQLAHH